jgi:magnesium chelatase accessory protein
LSVLESDRMRWSVDGLHWPHRSTSRFVEASGLRWHVQVAGTGPDLLLLHGAGGSTHSWAGVLPGLSRSFRVVAPDLPGHAFTEALPPGRATLEELATAVTGVLDAVGAKPTGIVAHSAGAAVALRMVLDGSVRPEGWAFIAPSLVRPSRGAPPPFIQNLLSPAFRSAGMVRLAATLGGRRGVVDTLLASTGSRVPPASRSCYRLLTGNPAHLGAVLDLMTSWAPESLAPHFPDVDVPGLVVVAARDGWIPAREILRPAARLPAAHVRTLSGLGHLAHEEAPERVLDLIVPFLTDGTLPPDSPTDSPGDGAGDGR